MLQVYLIPSQLVFLCVQVRHLANLMAPFLITDPIKYRKIVGSLLYLTLIRPNIAFCVNKLCQFVTPSNDIHWLVMKHVLRYLKGTLYNGLVLSKFDQLELLAYCDVDWASAPNNWHSPSAYCVFLGKSCVSWHTSKQKVNSRSSTESEYRVMVWSQQLLS